jgi:DNA polymerase-3 subunit epsilon
VYRFLGPGDEVLYIGKSKQIRDRVRSHFRAGNDTRKHERLYRNTHDISTETTAGDFSARMRELYEIKNRQPLLNKQSRKKKQLVVARKQVDSDGFFYPQLQRVSNVNNRTGNRIIGVFRSYKHATSTIENLAREYQLCRRKLQISTAGDSDRSCFYYQLGQCRGACVGEETRDAYNDRFGEAFADYAVTSWPYDGSVVITDTREGRSDRFTVNRWCLQSAHTVVGSQAEPFFADQSMLREFYYDVYKLLAQALTKPSKSGVEINSQTENE